MPVGQRYVVVNIDGEDKKFHKMTPYDRMEVMEAQKKIARAEIEAGCAKLPAEQAFVELANFDKAFLRSDVIGDYIRSAAGRLDTYRRALEKSYSKEQAETILRAFTPTEDEELALTFELWGIALPKEEPKKEEKDETAYGEEGPNPQKPAEETYTPPAT
ncbi:MAG TPA: hypothetical protein VD994_00940 [Prosthecobacter sp.]|nr:hypothetical protein [Prosthecobacter sp.]